MKRKLFAAVIVLLLVSASCSKNNFREEPYFVLNPVGNIVFPAAGGSQDVNIKSNLLSWDIVTVESHDWCEIEKDANGAWRFKITALENTENVARADVIIEVIGQNDEVTIKERMKISQVAAEEEPGPDQN